MDLVITNPPFGGKAVVDDPHILSKYELTRYDAASSRSLLPAEQIFVEGALRYLKPGGRLAIVLPHSILNNPSLEFIRRWLDRRTRIIATVDLPKETFATSGGVPNPSVLVVQKLAPTEIALLEAGVDRYPVFMAIPQTCGIDKRGNPVYHRSPDGFDILDDRTPTRSAMMKSIWSRAHSSSGQIMSSSTRYSVEMEPVDVGSTTILKRLK